MTDIIALLSFTIAIAAVGIAIVIAHNQTRQSARIEDLSSDIYSYVESQKKKEKRLQIDFARGMLGLINYARMPIHGINSQIKFLKLLDLQYPIKLKWKKQQFKEEEDRHEQIEMYVKELRGIITKSAITFETILELFDDQTLLLYNKMWKMFVYTEPFFTRREDYYKTLMDFIDVGVEASEELHKKMLEFIPELQKKGYSLHTVKAS